MTVGISATNSSCTSNIQNFDHSTLTVPIQKRLDKILEEDTYEYTCTDGKDDGKLSFKEAASCVFDGVKKNLKEKIVDKFFGYAKSFKEHPVKTTLKTLAIAGITVGTMALLGPVAVPILGGIGFCIAVHQGIKAGKEVIGSIKDAKNATTDKEAKEAFLNIGDKGTEVVECGIAAYCSAKVVTGSLGGTLQPTPKPTGQVSDVENAKEIVDGVENVVNNIEDVNEIIQGALNQDKKEKLLTNMLKLGSSIFITTPREYKTSGR